jgi:hypothetical protein
MFKAKAQVLKVNKKIVLDCGSVVMSTKIVKIHNIEHLSRESSHMSHSKKPDPSTNEIVIDQ